jgi:hypothetical protein
LLDSAISLLCFKRVYAFTFNIVGLMDGLEVIHQDILYLFVHMRICWGMCKVGAISCNNRFGAELPSKANATTPEFSPVNPEHAKDTIFC